jgi:hypothetical protein
VLTTEAVTAFDHLRQPGYTRPTSRSELLDFDLKLLSELILLVNSRRILSISFVALLLSLGACGGGGGGSDFSNVSVSVSPANATVVAGGQVALQATVTGLPAGTNPAVNWTIAELQASGASGAQCNWLGSNPPAGPCPDGTIQGADGGSVNVVYHAPGASGTFHVIATWSSAFTPVVARSATATITVTP